MMKRECANLLKKVSKSKIRNLSNWYTFSCQVVALPIVSLGCPLYRQSHHRSNGFNVPLLPSVRGICPLSEEGGGYGATGPQIANIPPPQPEMQLPTKQGRCSRHCLRPPTKQKKRMMPVPQVSIPSSNDTVAPGLNIIINPM
jgi:hypothetical protein